MTGGKLRLHLPVTGDTEITAWHHYQVPSGDFNIQVDMSDYINDNATGNEAMLIISDDVSTHPETDSGINDWASMRYTHGGSTPYTGFKCKKNGVPLTSGPRARSGLTITKLRLRRISTTIYFDFYIDGSGWSGDGSYNFEGYAANLITVGVGNIHRGSHGGEVKFDNLIFKEGCPTGTIAWTSTSTSTSTSSTTSSTASTSSTSSTASTISTTSSTASTLSTTSSTHTSTTTTTTSSSTSSTASTISTTSSTSSTTSSTSSTASTISSTSSTASTLSTTSSTHTSTTSTCTTTSTPPP